MTSVSNISRRRTAKLSQGSNTEYKAKRDELVAIAARLFKQKGFGSVTFAQIAREAGVDRATVYYYFASKDELFRETVRGMVEHNLEEVERLAQEKSRDPKVRLHQVMEVLMCSYESDYPYMYVYIQEQMHQIAGDSSPWAQDMMKQTRRFEAVVMDLINQGVSEGVLRDDIPVRIAANALFGMFNWTHRWYRPGGKLNGRELADHFMKIFFDGAGAADGPDRTEFGRTRDEAG